MAILLNLVKSSGNSPSRAEPGNADINSSQRRPTVKMGVAKVPMWRFDEEK